MMTSTVQQPLPLSAQVERRDFGDGHLKQFRCEARRLLVIALNSLGRQLLINMLPEELLKEHRERFWEWACNAGARLCQIPLLILIDPSLRLCVLRFALSREARF